VSEWFFLFNYSCTRRIIRPVKSSTSLPTLLFRSSLSLLFIIKNIILFSQQNNSF
jgi:hypothetical protein